ncbi:MAG: PAS domain-containing protein [Deltaproteobacteria bacterium]
MLGVIDIGMSLKAYDAYVRATSFKVILLGLATVLLVVGTLVAYILLRVDKPVNKLLAWINAMMVGKPAGKSPVNSRDELGQLAKAFSILSARMQRRTQELERSREQYRTLFEHVPCFISVIDRDFKIVRQNTKMREFFRGTIGMHCYEVYKKQPEKCDICSVADTFLNGKGYTREECGLTVSGEEANYLSYTVPVRDEKGEVICAMVIAIDIGDRIRLQKELQISLDFQANLIENSIHGIIATDEIVCR